MDDIDRAAVAAEGYDPDDQPWWPPWPRERAAGGAGSGYGLRRRADNNTVMTA